MAVASVVAPAGGAVWLEQLAGGLPCVGGGARGQVTPVLAPRDNEGRILVPEAR